MDYQDIDNGVVSWSNLFREEQEAIDQLAKERLKREAIETTCDDVTNDDR